MSEKKYTFHYIKELTNLELQNFSIEATTVYNAEAPAKVKKSKLLQQLLDMEIGISYMDKFSNLVSSIRSEIIFRFNNKQIN